jgi:hypothetical protein
MHIVCACKSDPGPLTTQCGYELCRKINFVRKVKALLGYFSVTYLALRKSAVLQRFQASFFLMHIYIQYIYIYIYICTYMYTVYICRHLEIYLLAILPPLPSASGETAPTCDSSGKRTKNTFSHCSCCKGLILLSDILLGWLSSKTNKITRRWRGVKDDI